jgi:hypothetical protein
MSSQNSQLPAGTKRVIIFDTNAYRVLGHGMALNDARAKALQLRRCEQSVGVFVLASPVTVWELITHLADPADPALPHCLNALVMLGEHALSPGTSNGGISLFADSESTVCRELFRSIPPGYETGIQTLGSLVTYIGKYAPNLTDSVAVQNINTIASAMIAKEQAWLNQMKAVVANCDPNAARVVFGGRDDNEVLKKARAFFDSEQFMEAWAAWMVITHAAKVNHTIDSLEEIRQKTAVLRTEFSVPFHLMSALLKRLATPQPPNLANPKKKRWNFVCDSMIAFSIGSSHEIAGAPMYLVTGDHEIFEAAKAAGCDDRVVTLDDYLKGVGLP